MIDPMNKILGNETFIVGAGEDLTQRRNFQRSSNLVSTSTKGERHEMNLLSIKYYSTKQNKLIVKWWKSEFDT